MKLAWILLPEELPFKTMYELQRYLSDVNEKPENHSVRFNGNGDPYDRLSEECYERTHTPDGKTLYFAVWDMGGMNSVGDMLTMEEVKEEDRYPLKEVIPQYTIEYNQVKPLLDKMLNKPVKKDRRGKHPNSIKNLKQFQKKDKQSETNPKE